MDDTTFNSGYRFGVTDHGWTKVLNNSQEDSVQHFYWRRVRASNHKTP